MIQETDWLAIMHQKYEESDQFHELAKMNWELFGLAMGDLEKAMHDLSGALENSLKNIQEYREELW